MSEEFDYYWNTVRWSALTDLMQRNYAATVRRGLITPETKKIEFFNKIYEETQELELAYLNADKFNEAEELADVVLVCLAYAQHFGIDIVEALEQKVKYNEQRGGLMMDEIKLTTELQCPLCKSLNIADISTYQNNGVLGSGYASWKTSDFRCCNDCGIVFKPIKTKDHV